MPLTPFSGTLGIKRAAHLLRRATFGGSKEDIDNFSVLTAPEAIARLFTTGLPEPPIPRDIETNTEWVTEGRIEDVNSDDRTLRTFIKDWFIGQMLSAGATSESEKLPYATREKLTYFLHTHFTTIAEKVGNSRAIYFQNVLLRLFAFDKEDRMVDVLDEDSGITTSEIAPTNIKELTKKLCIDNAMLVFLDGNQNVKGSPNENYAREMFELFTIGRGLEARIDGMSPSGPGDYFTFTEQDVKAAARVLTGFKFDDTFSTIDDYTGLPRGIAETGQHSTNSSDKVFSSYFGGETIDADPTLMPGGVPTEESMIDEISQLIDLIFDREETTKQICRKLYRFYAYYNIDENLDDTIISEMAATLVANDYKIQPVLEELLQSEHFYEALAGNTDDKFGGIIKSPLDLVLGSMTFFETPVPDYETQLEDFYNTTNYLLGEIRSQGLDLYEPYEVAGYVAYHQYPIYNRNWISTNYLTLRYNFIRTLTDPASDMLYIDLLAYTQAKFGNAATDGKEFVKLLASYTYPFADNLDYDSDGGDLTKERMRYFLQAFLQFTDYSDTAQVNLANTDWGSFYNNDADYLQAGEYLRRLYNSMFQTPEYQLF